jgi:uncharacterized membrane protein
MKPALHETELRIARFLRAGTIFSGSLLLIGWLWNFDWHSDPFFNFQHYDQIPFTQLYTHAWNQGSWGALLVYAGLVALISLPVIRVLLTMLLFLQRRERTMALLAGVVFLGLIISMILGIEL